MRRRRSKRDFCEDTNKLLKALKTPDIHPFPLPPFDSSSPPRIVIRRHAPPRYVCVGGRVSTAGRGFWRRPSANNAVPLLHTLFSRSPRGRRCGAAGQPPRRPVVLSSGRRTVFMILSHSLALSFSFSLGAGVRRDRHSCLYYAMRR